MKIKFKKLSETAKIPTRGSTGAAGYDLYGDNEDWLIVRPNNTVKIPLNISMEIPQGYFGAIYARSGLATKQGLRPSNCVGIIDEDYRGNIIIALTNDTDETQKIQPHERVAQMIFHKYIEAEFVEVDELSNTDRAKGGFGSTGRV